MNETLNPDIAWNEYKDLEEKFLNYLRYVPLTKEHCDVWSLHLGDLLMIICSILDSFFRRSIYCSELDGADKIRYYRSLNDIQINMGTYRVIFDQFYQLSSKNIYLLNPFVSFSPFANWKSNLKLEWWGAYNHVKHDRFKNKKEATLQSTFNALGALFILNVLHLETMPVLVDYEIIKSGLAKSYLKYVLLKKEPLDEIEIVYAKTKLFGYVFKSKKYEPDFKWILSSSYPGY